jgi:hypothetical protein
MPSAIAAPYPPDGGRVPTSLPPPDMGDRDAATGHTKSHFPARATESSGVGLTVTEMESFPCGILITNVSGSGLILESHSSASITRR